MLEFLPKISYPLYNNNDVLVFDKTTVDISKAFVFSSTLGSDTDTKFSFHYYEVDEYETPQMVASKLYNNPNYYWVVLILNDIINPYTDWFMSSETLRQYTIDKYKGSDPTFERFLATAIDDNRFPAGSTNKDLLNKIKFKNPETYVTDIEFQDFMKKFDDFVRYFNILVLSQIHHYVDIRDDTIINDWKAEQYTSRNEDIPEYIKAITVFEHEYELNQKRKLIKVLDNKHLNSFVLTIESILK